MKRTDPHNELTWCVLLHDGPETAVAWYETEREARRNAEIFEAEGWPLVYLLHCKAKGVAS